MSTLVKQLRTSIRIPFYFKMIVLKAIKKMPGMERNLDLCPDNHFEYIDFNMVDGKRRYLFEDAETLEEALELWHWHPEVDETGNIVNLIFGGRTDGDYDILFAVIAPWVATGCYIEMVNDDGCRFCFDFQDGEMTEVNLGFLKVVEKAKDWDKFWKGKPIWRGVFPFRNQIWRVVNFDINYRSNVSFLVGDVALQTWIKIPDSGDYYIFAPKGSQTYVFRGYIAKSTKQMDIPLLSFVCKF